VCSGPYGHIGELHVLSTMYVHSIYTNTIAGCRFYTEILSLFAAQNLFSSRNHIFGLDISKSAARSLVQRQLIYAVYCYPPVTMLSL